MLRVSTTKNLNNEYLYYEQQRSLAKPYTHCSDEQSLGHEERSSLLLSNNPRILKQEKQTNLDLINRRRRRYQPYPKPSSNHNNAPQESIQEQDDPFFGPVPSLTLSNYQSSSSSNSSLLLQDYEIFDEFDHFIQSPTRFLSSPPPSPSLSPSDDVDLDFGDFPLFP